MHNSLSIVWHRRDLRVHDNPALHRASQPGGAVLGVFVVDRSILGWTDTAPARVFYLRESVLELQQAYAELGGRLVIRIGKPLEQLVELVESVRATALYFNDDVEPYALDRDRQVSEALTARGVAVCVCPEILLHPAEEVRAGQGQPYVVFTPYWRNWSVRPKPKPFPKPDRLQSPEAEPGHFPPLRELIGSDFAQSLLIAPGERAARAQLDAVAKDVLYHYDDRRDLPALVGTSRMSAHLKFGTVGIREVWQRSREVWKQAENEDQRRNLSVWQQELGWREFYKYVLHHFPHVATGPFRKQFDRFAWENDKELFERWCRGETGYPLVDAAMGQLNTVCWMHNRLRMVVASFLTKDLLIDYRWGEHYFMSKLVDGDLSANNGGWQWAASVGTDPKPLRIFNPSTQAKRYDPEAKYIRRWLPELAIAPTAGLIDPGRLAADWRSRCAYPAPIVDHQCRQQMFKDRYRLLKSHPVEEI